MSSKLNHVPTPGRTQTVESLPLSASLTKALISQSHPTGAESKERVWLAGS